MLAPPKLKPVPCIANEGLQYDGMHDTCHMCVSGRLRTDRRRGSSTKVKCHTCAIQRLPDMTAHLDGHHVCSPMTSDFPQQSCFSKLGMRRFAP